MVRVHNAQQLQVSYWNDYGTSSTNIAGVALPPKLRCSMCSKNKGTQANFSKKELAGLQEAIARKGQSAAQTHEVSCVLCKSGSISTEMTCVDCHKTMGLAAFAKTHRRDRDNAKCMKCMQKRVSIRALKTNEAETSKTRADVPSDEYDDDDGSTTDYGSSQGTSSMSDSRHSVAFSSASGGSNAGSFMTASSANTPGGQSGGVALDLSDDWFIGDHAYQDSSAGPIASGASGSTVNSVNKSGVTSKAANASYTSSSSKIGPHQPYPLHRVPASEHASESSIRTTDTETGSRAKFVRFPKIKKTNDEQFKAHEDSGSEEDEDWKGDQHSAAGDEDSNDDSDTEEVFWG